MGKASARLQEAVEKRVDQVRGEGASGLGVEIRRQERRVDFGDLINL